MPPDWQVFWAKESDPRYPGAADFLVNHARELRLVCGDPSGRRVLELGCGSGVLFHAMGLDAAASYRGVDFSASMLAVFRVQYPAADLACAEASGYLDGGQYDLIFSNQVAQYFTAQMYRRHIANACAMLAPGGRLVVASIPWRGARTAYYLQAGAPARQRRLLRGAAVLARSWAGIDRLGRWYSYRECTAAASRQGLTATYFGCLQFPYRFHVRMERAAAN